MKKNIKKLVAVVFAFVIMFTYEYGIVEAFYQKKNEIFPSAWAGRPGGNNGVEEWTSMQNQIGYGEMYGDYKLVSTNTGAVRDLNKGRSTVTSIILGLIGLPNSKLFSGISFLASIFSSYSGGFIGEYYKSYLYASGRRNKLVFKFYDSNHNLVDTKVEISKW
ncbi:MULTISPECIES: hypothetical protein [Helcococcus]|uniref:Uncharacterized protein n=1 Tax=Helcococcus bovis TaxID=3153252 RepID=A0ABW9F971_9FIRM